jgi:uncharacterized protein YjbJ (UPF0337 family)
MGERFDEFTGRVEEGTGSRTGDESLEAEGKALTGHEVAESEGRAQRLRGEADRTG